MGTLFSQTFNINSILNNIGSDTNHERKKLYLELLKNRFLYSSILPAEYIFVICGRKAEYKLFENTFVTFLDHAIQLQFGLPSSVSHTLSL